MSTPSNPLSKFFAHDAKHVLIAFDNSEVACGYKVSDNLTNVNTATQTSGTIGAVGTKLPNLSGGSGYVVVNELTDQSYFMNNLTWSFEFFGPLGNGTTSCVGSFSITDVTGTSPIFPNFIRDIGAKMAKDTGAKAPISVSQMTFVLYTFFRGHNPSGTTTVIPVKPLIFSVVDFGSALSNSQLFAYDFVAQYNSLGQLPQYSAMSQMTITNQSGGLGQTVPVTSGGTTGIMTTAQENAAKNASRTVRLGKAPAMVTLKDVFNGFQQGLQDQIKSNKRQLQEFMGLVRDDYVKKIEIPVQQKDAAGGIQIDYVVDLDPAIASYQVNNRNLPFEQPAQSQNATGIVSLTMPIGSTIPSCVNELLKLSTAIADDIAQGYSFKTTISSVKKLGGNTTITVMIRRYARPQNDVNGKISNLITNIVSGATAGAAIGSAGGILGSITGAIAGGFIGAEFGGPPPITTAPGNGAINPLGFYYSDGNKVDVDVLDIQMSTGSDYHIAVLEEEARIGGDAKCVYGNREQISIERSPLSTFSNSFMSGVRGLGNPKNYGLESAVAATNIDINNIHSIMRQTSMVTLLINGNSDLYSDLARNPLKVSTNDQDGATLYKYPEYEPMYVKLLIRLKQTNSSTPPPVGDPVYFYYTEYYHLSGVQNIIDGSTFYQRLELMRTDDAQ
jgi:uncharacterized protein YcfJ